MMGVGLSRFSTMDAAELLAECRRLDARVAELEFEREALSAMTKVLSKARDEWQRRALAAEGVSGRDCRGGDEPVQNRG